jgi:hypothetical protein
MESLKVEFPDEETRKAHILKNMLYMSEIGYKNVEICKMVFGEDCNLYHGDSLELDTVAQWNIPSFDVVVGNPPYNLDHGNKGKGNALWPAFLERSLKVWTKVDGYLCFVHPPLWRQIGQKLFDEMKSRQLLWIEMHTVEDGSKTFHCSTTYDMYVLQNSPRYTTTAVKCIEGREHCIDMSEWCFLPNSRFNEIKQLMTGEDKLEILHSESAYEVRRKWMSKTQTSEHIYPVVYSIKQDNTLSLTYSSTNENGHYDIPKFIFTNGAGYLYDVKGEYAMSQWASAIVDTHENMLRFEEVFRSSEFKAIMDAIKLDSARYNIKVMRQFSKPTFCEFLKTNSSTSRITPEYPLRLHSSSLQLFNSTMSSSLDLLLKQQIRDAISHLYNVQGTAAANRYSHPDEFSKALLDVLFPAEAEHNTQVTGVVQVPTVDEPKSDSESSDSSSKKERKKRAPMTEEQKAAMKAKREATLAAKKVEAAPAPAPAPEPEPVEDKKERKPRAPMTDEQKAAMAAKRAATLAAKKAAVA